MNDTNHDDRDQSLTRALNRGATTLRPPADVRARIRAEILAAAGNVTADDAEPDPGPAADRRWRLPLATWRLASAAVVTIAAAGLAAAFLLWPVPLTRAAVLEAVAAETWIHIRFDNGEERWQSTTHGVFARIAPQGHRFFIDRASGVRHVYWPHPPVRITEDRVAAGTDDASHDAWDATAGQLEALIADPGRMRDVRVERATESLDGRELVRFDSFLIDALGERILFEQLWADPESRLPVKRRQRLQLGEREDREDRDDAYVTGFFDFPDTGPASIYDLGVPRDVQIVNVEPKPLEPAVADLLENLDAAWARFPTHYRLLTWGPPPSDQVGVIHWSGEIRFETYSNGTRHPDHGDVRYRHDHYYNMGPEYPDYNLPLPTTADMALAWTLTQTPVNVNMFDGEIAYMQNGPYPSMFGNADPPTLYVRRLGNVAAAGATDLPTRFQWPLANQGTGREMELLKPSDETPPGTVGLRMVYSDELHTDYYFDPARDHVCVKTTRWEVHGEDWLRKREVVLEDLVQLPGGQWMATTRRILQIMAPGRRQSESVRHYDLTVLEPDDFDPALFDGELILERAHEQGVNVETY